LHAAPQSVLNDSTGINPAELAKKIENLQVEGGSDTGEKLFGSSGGVSPLAGDKVNKNKSISSINQLMKAL